MTASQLLLPGTTSSRLPRSVAGLVTAVLLALMCLSATAHAAPAERPTAATPAPVRLPAVGERSPDPTARAALRGCAAAHGLLRGRRSMLRTRRRLLCLMNRARARFGLPRLRANRCLHRVASRHAHDMVHRRYFGHVTPNGWDPGRRARVSGYVPRSARWVVGENIAWGVATAARPAWVMRQWMHSPGHRHNILSRRFRDAGIGVARGTPSGGFLNWRLRATYSVEFGAHGGRSSRCARSSQRARRRAAHVKRARHQRLAKKRAAQKRRAARIKRRRARQSAAPAPARPSARAHRRPGGRSAPSQPPR